MARKETPRMADKLPRDSVGSPLGVLLLEAEVRQGAEVEIPTWGITLGKRNLRESPSLTPDEASQAADKRDPA
jgi:hypothetical protein